MKDAAEGMLHAIRNSQGLRLLAVGVLVLLLQIPIALINGLVSERQGRRQAAVDEVSAKWGHAQSITGPALVLPYRHEIAETVAGAQHIVRTETRYAVVLAENLRIRGTLDADVRQRGIFSVPVYKLGLVLDGAFGRPPLAELGIDPRTVDWARAHVAVGISDARAIQEATTLTWNDAKVAFLPGTGGFTEAGSGIRAPVPMSDATERTSFSFPLTLNGSLRMDVVPFARNTIVELRGDNGNPSFQGNWLPAERTVSNDAFSAKWAVSFLGRSYPQAWTSGTDVQKAIDASRFGVALMDPVDHYRMTERSVKYAGLFILLTFATIWLIEVLTGVRVHPIQYLMLGGALCLFYLLELSLSEHIGFPLAYVAASCAVIGMVGGYSVAALRRVSRAVVVAAGVALLYGYLYLLLMNEDYALLIGSIGLFAILGAIMFATRRVDWYGGGARAVEPSGAQHGP